MLRLGDVEARSSSYSCNQRSELMFLIAQHSSFLIYVRAFDQIYLKSDWQVGALGSGCMLVDDAWAAAAFREGTDPRADRQVRADRRAKSIWKKKGVCFARPARLHSCHGSADALMSFQRCALMS